MDRRRFDLNYENNIRLLYDSELTSDMRARQGAPTPASVKLRYIGGFNTGRAKLTRANVGYDR
jgi:hypothetical protein